MPHTLVTGGNSFFAAHVISELIAQGHQVTGSVRRAAAGEKVLQKHPEWKDHLSFVEISDYATPGAWDDIFQKHDFDYIVHAAAPVFDDPANTDYDQHFLRPAVEGNTSLLRSAKQYAKNLKAIAITGSINAATTGSPEELANPVTNKTWVPITQEFARATNSAIVSYCSSKKEAELAVWRFVETEKPSFGVTVFLPALIHGPPIQPLQSIDKINFSTAQMYALFSGKLKATPRTMFPSYIDARDLATAHVKALTTPETHGHRYLLGGARWTNTTAVDTIRRLAESGELPKELLERLPETPGDDVDVPIANIEAAEANKLLDLKFRPLEETLRDTVKAILELEKASK